VQVSLFVDGQLRSDPVVAAGNTGPLAATVDGAAQLTLRITCDRGATSVTFADPGLYR
jgi:hypothetical protein